MRALEIVFRILWSVVLGGLIYGSAIWLLRVELSGDIERMEPGKAWLLGGLAWINAVVILVIGGMDGRLPEENRLVILGAQGILCSLLAGGLLAAACMDAVHSYVYNYVWWWCLPWAGILGLTAGGGFHGIVAVLVFVMLQQLLFSRMYGKADCHAFSVCALAECGNAVGMVGVLLQMFLSVVLLTIVQLFRGNVTPRGRLREPQPFIPYIITAFFSVTFLESVFRTTYIYA